MNNPLCCIIVQPLFLFIGTYVNLKNPFFQVGDKLEDTPFGKSEYRK